MDIFIQILFFEDDKIMKLKNELSYNQSNAIYWNVNETQALFHTKTIQNSNLLSVQFQ